MDKGQSPSQLNTSAYPRLTTLPISPLVRASLNCLEPHLEVSRSHTNVQASCEARMVTGALHRCGYSTRALLQVAAWWSVRSPASTSAAQRLTLTVWSSPTITSASRLNVNGIVPDWPPPDQATSHVDDPRTVYRPSAS